MKPYVNITCGVLTSCDLSAHEWVMQVAGLFGRHSWVVPTHVGNVEPIREPYGGDASLLACWQDPFLWKSARSKIQGSIWFGRGKQHSCLYVSQKFRKGAVEQQQWVNFLTDSCRILSADLGYVHIMTDAELNDARVAQGAAYALDR